MSQIFIGFLIFFSGLSFSEHQTLRTHSPGRPVAARTCPGFDANDPFSLNVRYTRGPRAGQCMNLFDYRPVHLLTEEEAHQYAAKAQLPPPEPGEIWAGNVWHRGKFYVVRIPPNAVEDVLFQIERFDPEVPILRALNKRRWFAAHAQVRFKLKTGKEALYIPQKLNDFSNPIRLSNLVISSEAVRSKGEPFGPLKGNADHYGLAKRALSIEEVIDVSVRGLKHQIAQYPIKILASPGKIDQARHTYLLSALQRGDKDFESYKRGKPVYYNTQARNCLSEAIDIFDDVTNYCQVSPSQERAVERRPRELLPSLQQRGLLEKRNYPSLNREFGYPNY
jgi:hypothetical protein